MRYRNPANGYTETISGLAWLHALVFGPFFFTAKGVWTHAVISFLIAPFVLPWLIYPFFATEILHTHYLRKGWQRISDQQPDNRTLEEILKDG